MKKPLKEHYEMDTDYGTQWAIFDYARDLEKYIEYLEQQVKNCNIKPFLPDKEIEEYIWEEISIPLSKIDIDTQSDEYIQYLNAVHWAKWGRDNSNGL